MVEVGRELWWSFCPFPIHAQTGSARPSCLGLSSQVLSISQDGESTTFLATYAGAWPLSPWKNFFPSHSQSCSLQPHPKWFLLWNLVQVTLKHLYYLWTACWTAGQWIRLSCLGPVTVLCDWLVSIYRVLSNITCIRKPQDVMNHTILLMKEQKERNHALYRFFYISSFCVCIVICWLVGKIVFILNENNY